MASASGPASRSLPIFSPCLGFPQWTVAFVHGV
ncbi:hypothetical protein T09_2031 [Trichinella sp. T9]|nr:hypothetical protein T09_2031 [Trichinella sp. T9]